MKNLNEFLDEHNACQSGRERAKAFSSLEDAWENCAAGDLLWLATRPGVLTDRELRLFAVFCARQVSHLLADDRSRAAIDAAERFADGGATEEELATAYAACAAYEAARAAHAAYEAARAARAAHEAAYEAADAAADAAAYAAADARADADATRAARAAVSQRGAAWLRTNTYPNFR